MMLPENKIAVLYHIFYEDTVTYIAEELRSLKRFQPFFFFNISAETPNQLELKRTLLTQFPGSVVAISSNKGKDIGGKLLLLNACIELGVEPDWIIFLHDKKSLQALNSKTWKSDLLKIIDGAYLDEINIALSTDKEYGIVATHDYVIKQVRKDGSFIGPNGSILNQLVELYNVHCTPYAYVAGTMFWGNGPALMSFFKMHNPLVIRQTLEEGNVLDNFGDTNTHAWERLISWIILSQGLKVKTI
jgi:lipopolysaccharide biosynthesis protein